MAPSVSDVLSSWKESSISQFPVRFWNAANDDSKPPNICGYILFRQLSKFQMRRLGCEMSEMPHSNDSFRDDMNP